MSRFLTIAAGAVLFASVSLCQQAPADTAQAPQADAGSHADKHILGIIPNFRTSPTLDHYVPISAGEKFKIARQDSDSRENSLGHVIADDEIGISCTEILRIPLHALPKSAIVIAQLALAGENSRQ